tara:strand:- start:12688 stop:13788 length:1101 start_codon:yes stop_codon:yes gene_type:complete
MVINVEDTAARLRGTQRRLMSGALDFEPGAAPVKALSRLKFPLENETDYKAYILFQPVITTPPALGDGMAVLGEMFKSLTDTVMYAGTGTAPTGATPGTRPPDAIGGQSEAKTAFDQNGKRAILKNETKANSKMSCKMYMPSNITFQDGVNYSTADLGFVGGAASEAISNGGGVLEGLASGGVQSLDNFYQSLRGSVSQDAARLGATRLAGLAGKNGVIDGAVRGSLRTSPISNMTMLFDKPNLRTFSFTFKMQPTSEAEAREIVKIVKFFRTELYPDAFDTDTLGGISVPFGYRFPNEINISMHYGSSSKKDFIRFKPCYLTNFQATFNAPSASFFKGGHFQETNISMTLRENELLNKKDIQDGF